MRTISGKVFFRNHSLSMILIPIVNVFSEYSDLKNVGLKVNDDNIAEFWFDFFWDEDVSDDFFGNFTRRREVDVPFKVTPTFIIFF